MSVSKDCGRLSPPPSKVPFRGTAHEEFPVAAAAAISAVLAAATANMRGARDGSDRPQRRLAGRPGGGAGAPRRYRVVARAAAVRGHTALHTAHSCLPGPQPCMGLGNQPKFTFFY
eukprot:COSAG01_NODE_530_length_15875_cov_27.779982_16_plen_116_part_00